MAISLHQNDHGHGHSHSHSHSSSQRERSMSTTSLLSPDNGYASGDHYGSMTRTENSHTQVPSSQSPQKTSNINVRAAFIHVLGDLCQSVGVLVAAIIIYFKVKYIVINCSLRILNVKNICWSGAMQKLCQNSECNCFSWWIFCWLDMFRFFS